MIYDPDGLEMRAVKRLNVYTRVARRNLVLTLTTQRCGSLQRSPRLVNGNGSEKPHRIATCCRLRIAFEYVDHWQVWACPSVSPKMPRFVGHPESGPPFPYAVFKPHRSTPQTEPRLFQQFFQGSRIYSTDRQTTLRL